MGQEQRVSLVSDEADRSLPFLVNVPCEIASERTTDYNCFAFAAGETHVWWEPYVFPPAPDLNIYWPPGVGVQGTVEDYEAAFATRGFVRCANGEIEADCVKIVIFADDGGPMHAARQLRDGRWHSKLGDLEDVIHDSLEGLAEEYGKKLSFLKRPRRDEDK